MTGTTLYGTTKSGGANGDGTVFSVPITGGSPTTLKMAFNGPNGNAPEADLILSGSTLYGTTFYGGANGDGTVFSLDLNTDLVTTLASFNGTNGEQPFAGLTLSGSTLYGTTYYGGANGDGTVFSLQISAVPEPSTRAMLLGGLGLLAFWRTPDAPVCCLIKDTGAFLEGPCSCERGEGAILRAGALILTGVLLEVWVGPSTATRKVL